MFNTSNLFLIYLLIILFFLGCDTLSFNKKIITAEGKRLDILDYKEELSVNSQAADIAVVLGKLEKNNSWNQSGMTSTHSPGNLYLSENPKLIIMDLSLPVLDGWTAAQQLKADKNTKSIPIIALTAHAMKGDREKALEAGCDEYDTKPVNFERLLGKINQLTNS